MAFVYYEKIEKRGIRADCPCAVSYTHLDVYKRQVHPLPRKLIEEFASKVDKLYIFEELEPVFEEQIKSWGIACSGKDVFTLQGEYSANMIRKMCIRDRYDVDLPQRKIQLF